MAEGLEMLADCRIEEGAFQDGLADIVERDASNQVVVVRDDEAGAQAVVEALLNDGNQILRRFAYIGIFPSRLAVVPKRLRLRQGQRHFLSSMETPSVAPRAPQHGKLVNI